MKKLPNIYERLFPIRKFATIKEYFEHYVFEENLDDLDEVLYDSNERKQWVNEYPNLGSFSNTLDYIKDENSVPLLSVATELSDVELCLPMNEVLFHSGNLPNGVSLFIGTEFKLKEIFSATLDPYIAIVHDGEDDVYWYIQTKSENIRCLPVPDEFGEYEVIILGSPTAKIVDIISKRKNPMWLKNMSYKDPTDKTIVYIELY
ncbi:MAG: hypothetical protein Q4D86_00040 [Pasteurella oralis]|uniref:hypothetical protein n=1 Tax=Pasteurella oralis TaxID=1071947 RepID=UPI00270D5D44|nr:hypothetical protein [Pasteurella oralis]